MQWDQLLGPDSDSHFANWLEQTAPLEWGEEVQEAVETLDTLDGVLLSAIEELEQIDQQQLAPGELEGRLKHVWQRSYAHFASHEEAQLAGYFVTRGRALSERIYPDSSQRRRLYRTSLPPRSGNALLNLYPTIQKHLMTGTKYADWTGSEQFEYMRATVEMLAGLRRFGLESKAGRSEVDWRDILHWWLDPLSAPSSPTSTKVSDWHDYVSQNFQYRFNWGLGSIVALAFDEAFRGELRAPALEDWTSTGLPWIVFWLKELIVWGTLDPVAAFLMARGIEVTRDAAIRGAREYYQEVADMGPNERLNAATIRDWANRVPRPARPDKDSEPPSQVSAMLQRDFSGVESRHWRVIPVPRESLIDWLDPAGFTLAVSAKPEGWNDSYLKDYDFVLDSGRGVVSATAYL